MTATPIALHPIAEPPTPTATTRAKSVTQRLRAFLAAYWLRPENALWMTLRSMALDSAPPLRPAADFACGDGIFSFLHADGRLDPEFDVFQAAGRLDEVHATHADMFDVTPANYAPRIIQHPAWRLTMGFDLKPALLAKAAALRFYEGLRQHDLERPVPLGDQSLAWIYCNSAYWIRDIDGLLRELHRVIRPDGRVVLHVKLAAMADYTLEGLRDVLGETFLRIIGRSRLASWPTVASRSEWEQRFGKAGFEIQAAVPFATAAHAHLWDVGLRPLAPLLVRMANGLNPAERSAVKRDWVELGEQLALPLCRFDLDLGLRQSEPAEIQYVLTR